MKNEVQHDRENFCFFAVIDGHEVYIQYKQSGDEKIDVYKTFVPEELRGNGLAADLAESVLEFAKNENIGITPTCSYMQKYMTKV